MQNKQEVVLTLSISSVCKLGDERGRERGEGKRGLFPPSNPSSPRIMTGSGEKRREDGRKNIVGKKSMDEDEGR